MSDRAVVGVAQVRVSVPENCIWNMARLICSPTNVDLDKQYVRLSKMRRDPCDINERLAFGD
jgi:hypothetical protein